MESCGADQILYIGGYETTSHMIGNGIVALLTHPDQWPALRAAPELMRAAVDEMLRFDGPISLTQVVAAQGAELGGRPAEVGATYIGLLGAAKPRSNGLRSSGTIRYRQAPKGQRVVCRRCSLLLGAGAREARTRARVWRVDQALFPICSSPIRSCWRIPAFHQRAWQRFRYCCKP